MDEEKEICYEEACDVEETLETFNEDEYFKRQKSVLKISSRIFLRELLSSLCPPLSSIRIV